MTGCQCSLEERRGDCWHWCWDRKGGEWPSTGSGSSLPQLLVGSNYLVYSCVHAIAIPTRTPDPQPTQGYTVAEPYLKSAYELALPYLEKGYDLASDAVKPLLSKAAPIITVCWVWEARQGWQPGQWIVMKWLQGVFSHAHIPSFPPPPPLSHCSYSRTLSLTLLLERSSQRASLWTTSSPWCPGQSRSPARPPRRLPRRPSTS